MYRSVFPRTPEFGVPETVGVGVRDAVAVWVGVPSEIEVRSGVSSPSGVDEAVGRASVGSSGDAVLKAEVAVRNGVGLR